MEPKSKNDQFLSRMTALNKSFLSFIFKNLEEFPGADLTPTINSYLKHVDQLDKKFSCQDPKSNAPQSFGTSTTTDTLKRKRPLPSSNELRTFGGNPSKQAKKTVEEPEVEQAPEGTLSALLQKPADPKLPNGEPAKSNAPAPQFPSFFGQSKPAEQPKIVDTPKRDVSSNGPQLMGSLFGTASKPADPNLEVSASSTGFPMFNSFSQPKPADNEKKSETSTSTGGLFGSSFSQPKSDFTSSFSQPKPDFTSSFSQPKPADTADKRETSTSSNGTPLFPSLFGQKPADSSSTSEQSKLPSLPVGFQLFGNSFNPPKPAEPAESKPVTENASQSGTAEQDENEEPPKVELVEQKEDGALFCMKTAVFAYKDKKWDKMGVGYVNILPGDANKRLVVRAANTLGTIWINTHIAEHFKAFLKGDKAMTIRFPETGKDEKISIVQYLLKGGDPEEFTKLAGHMNANVLH